MKNMQRQNSTLASVAINTSIQPDRHQCLTRQTPVSGMTDSGVCHPPLQPTRKCLRCRRELPADAFYTRDRQQRPDSYCKECRKAANRIRRKAGNAHTEGETCPRRYPVITDIRQRDVRLHLILKALQTVRESVERKRRKQRESDCQD